MKTWTLEEDAAGRSVVRHHAPPRFTAFWASGADDRAAHDLEAWHDTDNPDDDARLCLYGFQWMDEPPAPEAFAPLMREACAFLDAWIAERL